MRPGRLLAEAGPGRAGVLQPLQLIGESGGLRAIGLPTRLWLPSSSVSVSEPDVDEVSVDWLALQLLRADLLDEVELLGASTPGIQTYRSSRTTAPPSRGGHDGARDVLLVHVLPVRSNTSAWPSKTAPATPPLPIILSSLRKVVWP